MHKTTFLALLVLIEPGLRWQTELNNNSKARLPPSFSQQDFSLTADAKSTILAHNLWDEARGLVTAETSITKDKKGKQGNKKNKVTKWHLRAVKLASFAAIEAENKVKLYRVGEKLPDGKIIKKILLDGIIIQDKTTIEYVYLFGKKA